MKRVISKEGYDEDLVTHSTQDIIDKCLNHYFKALEDGVKPEEARRIIPQAAYSTVWAAFMPMHLENYFKLRLDSHAQWEIQQTAIAMNELISKEF
jgi:thymidylate synthase (FAD)